MKNFLLCSLFVIILQSTLFPQLNVQTRKIPNENIANTYSNIKAPANFIGESIGVTTNYDYFSNSIIRDQIVYDKTTGIVHLANMVRPFNGPANVRKVVHSYKENGVWKNQAIINERASGWPQIDISSSNSIFGGKIGIVLHTPCTFALWEGDTNYTRTQFDPRVDPGFQFIKDNLFLTSSGDRLQYQFYKSTNQGNTFINFDSISHYHPSPIWWFRNGGVEIGVSKSPDENNLVYFCANSGFDGGAHAYNGIPEDQCDNIWMLKSTDAGNTFTGSMITIDGKINLVQNYYVDNFAPLFENLSQIDVAVANDGVVHFIANGFGPVFNAAHDSIIGNSFPLLYWNSATNVWKSLSSPGIDSLQGIMDYYPANNLGQGYPSISISEDGKIIYAIWTSPQLTAQETLDTLDGNYWRDLWHTYSTDGGNYWAPPAKYPGMLNNLSESYGHAAQHLEKISDNAYRAHIVYLADLNSTCSLFYGPLTNNPIVYTTFDINGNPGNSVVVKQPSGGVTWLKGSTQNIVWTSSQIQNVHLEYTTDAGCTWYTITESTPNTGSFEWTVPNTPSNNCNIRISEASDFFKYNFCNGEFSIVNEITTVNENIVKEFSLSHNYPNPFNPTTTIKYSLPEQRNISIVIYDALGREITKLADEEKIAGEYEVTWNAENYLSGVYFCRMKAGNYMDTRKLILMK